MYIRLAAALVGRDIGAIHIRFLRQLRRSGSPRRRAKRNEKRPELTRMWTTLAASSATATTGKARPPPAPGPPGP
jgi:hypothetical protein